MHNNTIQASHSGKPTESPCRSHAVPTMRHTSIWVIIGVALLLEALAMLLFNIGADAADKPASVFAYSDKAVGEWLDNNQNHDKFIAWASEELSEEQIASFNVLIAPPEKSKQDQLEQLRGILSQVEAQGGRAASDTALTDRIKKLASDLEKDIEAEADPIDDSPTPVGRN